jgi:hypothetical protein
MCVKKTEEYHRMESAIDDMPKHFRIYLGKD